MLWKRPCSFIQEKMVKRFIGLKKNRKSGKGFCLFEQKVVRVFSCLKKKVNFFATDFDKHRNYIAVLYTAMQLSA